MLILLIFFTTASLLFAMANAIDVKTRYTQSPWLLYSLPLLLVILMFGLRDGWMTDFPIYEYVFEHPATDDMYEPVFVLLNTVMRGLGFSFNGALTVYATCTFTGLFMIARLDRRMTGVMMIIFVSISLSFVSNTIRWATASGFIFASIALLDRKQYVAAVAVGLIAPLIHTVIAVLLVATWLLYFFPFIRNRYILLPLTFLSTLIPPSLLISILFNAATGIYDSGGINSDVTAAGYVSDEYTIEKYFAGERSEFGDAMTIIFKLRFFALFIWLLWEGHELIKRFPTKRLYKLGYQMAFIYSILLFPTWGIELTIRFVYFFFFGVAILAAPLLFWEWKERRYIWLAIGVLLLMFNFYSSVKTIDSGFHMNYIML